MTHITRISLSTAGKSEVSEGVLVMCADTIFGQRLTDFEESDFFGFFLNSLLISGWFLLIALLTLLFQTLKQRIMSSIDFNTIIDKFKCLETTETFIIVSLTTNIVFNQKNVTAVITCYFKVAGTDIKYVPAKTAKSETNWL